MDGVDNFQSLDDGPVLHILSFLYSPADLAHAMSVCKRWRVVGIEGCLWRSMCRNLSGAVNSTLDLVTDVKDLRSDAQGSPFADHRPQWGTAGAKKLLMGCGSGQPPKLKGRVPGITGGAEQNSDRQHMAQLFRQLETESRIFCQLAWELTSPPKPYNCIRRAIRASSTDNYPEEGIDKTLQPSPQWPNPSTPSYWSSKGKADSKESETLTYGLETPVCLVHEILVRPFQAYFQRGEPIYSARSVRFRFGHRVSQGEASRAIPEPPLTRRRILAMLEAGPEEKYAWTHQTPIFPMQKLDALQRFVLPQPVLCLGGIVQVELLERMQTQHFDELFYICICHVRAIGRPLPQFDYEVNPDGRTGTLKLLASAPVPGGGSLGLRQDEVRSRARTRRAPGNARQAAELAAANVADLERRMRDLRDRAAVDDEALAFLNWLLADVRHWPPQDVFAQMLQNVMQPERRALGALQRPQDGGRVGLGGQGAGEEGRAEAMQQDLREAALGELERHPWEEEGSDSDDEYVDPFEEMAWRAERED